MRFDTYGDYRLFYVDHSQQETVLHIDAASDEEACTFAQQHQHGLAVSIWHYDRLVTKLPPRRWAGGSREERR